MKRTFKTSFAAAAFGLAAMLPVAGLLNNASVANAASSEEVEQSTYTSTEIVSQGHKFFGTTTKGLAQAVEHIFAKAGRPRGYIIGEEGAGAFVGGLRYGEGTLFIKNGPSQKVFWQGPVGWFRLRRQRLAYPGAGL